MYKHILYFDVLAECLVAENWIKANIDEIEDAYVDDDPSLIHFCFYTSNKLLLRQQQIIIDTVKPTSYNINEEM